MTDDDSDDRTPQLRHAPVYMADPFGPGRDPTDPIVYMSRVPSERAQQIMAAVMREAGDAAPMQMVATLAERSERIEQHLCEMDGAIHGLAQVMDTGRIERVERVQREAERDRKRTRGYLFKGAGVAGTLLVSALAWFLHSTEARAAESQQLLDLIQRIDRLELDLREIRAALHRLGINTPSSGGTRLEPGLPPRPAPDSFGRMELTPFAHGVDAELRRIYAGVRGRGVFDRGAWQGVAACPEVAEPARVDQARALDVRVAGAEAGRLRGDIRGSAIGTAAQCNNDGEDETHASVLPHTLSPPRYILATGRPRPEGSEHALVSHP